MEDEIKKLLEKNLELNQEIFKMVKSIKNYVITQRIWFAIKILIILVPIILGIIYLPPLFKNVVGRYQQLLGLSQGGLNLESLLGGSGLDINKVDLDNVPADIKNYIK